MAKDYFLKVAETRLDPDAQPFSGFNKVLRESRSIDEMLGICKGVLADGIVNEAEAQFLRSWIANNPDAVADFAGKALADRLRRIVLDGKVSEEERLDLQGLLKQITGEVAQLPTGDRKATRIFFEDPEPTIVFERQAFSFTGKFVSGTRKWCVEQTVKRGGIFHDKPIRETNFLVVGTGGSRDWIHTAHGRKIEQAIEYRAKYGVKIVSEEHWASHVC